MQNYLLIKSFKFAVSLEISMVKNDEKAVVAANKKVKKVLIAQPQPEGVKSPYFDLAKKYNINIDFFPFIVVEGIVSKDFRKQKIDIAAFSAVIDD